MDYLSPKIVDELKENLPIPKRPVFDCFARTMDLLAAGIGLLIISPVLLILSLWIKLTDGGSVFFMQERMGKNGVPFRIIKFRSMVMNAESKGAKWRMNKNDERITPIGRVMREYHLDELPQLINVLKGDMALVGPRPALVFQKDYYESWEWARLAVPPGMTGLSQVSGGNALNWDQRIIVDAYYVRHRSFRLYGIILIKTCCQLFIKKGIYTQAGSVKGWTRPVPAWYKDSTEAEPQQGKTNEHGT